MGKWIAGMVVCVLAGAGVLVWADEGELFPEIHGGVSATRPKEPSREPTGVRNTGVVRPNPPVGSSGAVPIEPKLVRSATPVTLVKAGEGDVARGVLRRLPRQFLPVKTDKQPELMRKSAAIHEWLASDGDFGNGVKVTLTAKFCGASVFEAPRFKGPPPKAGEGPATMEGGNRQLTWRFKQELEFEGIPVRVWITDTRAVKGDEDRELRRSQELEKAGGGTATLTGKVMGVSVNLSRAVSVTEKGEIAESGDVPTISMTLHMERGGLVVAEQEEH